MSGNNHQPVIPINRRTSTAVFPHSFGALNGAVVLVNLRTQYVQTGALAVHYDNLTETSALEALLAI
jgi:hypothetical protein